MRAVQAMNRICVLDVDLQGVRNIKKTDLRPIYIFVQPPSLDVLVGAEPGRGGQPCVLGPADPVLCLRSSGCGSGTRRRRRAWPSAWQPPGPTWRAVSEGAVPPPPLGPPLTPQEASPQPRGAGGLEPSPSPVVPAKGPQTPTLFLELPLTLPPPPGKEPGLFDLIIVNDSLDKAYWALKEALSEVGWGGGGASGICVANGYSRLGQVIWWPQALGGIFLSSASLSLAGNKEGSSHWSVLRRPAGCVLAGGA